MTKIFNNHFISSIYINYQVPNLGLIGINWFVIFILLLLCLWLELFNVVWLPIGRMIMISLCYLVFLIFCKLTLQYNTPGMYELFKVQAIPSKFSKSYKFIRRADSAGKLEIISK